MARKLLNQADIGPVVPEIGAERVAKQVWRDVLLDTSRAGQGLQESRNISPAKALRICAIGDKQSRVQVRSSFDVLGNPPQCVIGKKYSPLLAAFTHNGGLFCARVNGIPVERERLRDARAGRQQGLE